MGLAVDVASPPAVVEEIVHHAQSGLGGWVLTPNLDHLRRYHHEPELRSIFDAASFVVADGMPLVWASRIAGRPLPGRVAGSDLIRHISVAAAQNDLSIFFLGGAPGAAEGAALVLGQEIPGLRVVGVHSPPIGFEQVQAELDLIDELIVNAQPDIVLVGLPFPRQEKLIAHLQPLRASTWFLGLGVSFSFVNGDVVRAPATLQRFGLEWAHRLLQEPRRLFTRYLVHGIPFAVRLFAWSAATRLKHVRS